MGAGQRRVPRGSDGSGRLHNLFSIFRRGTIRDFRAYFNPCFRVAEIGGRGCAQIDIAANKEIEGVSSKWIGPGLAGAALVRPVPFGCAGMKKAASWGLR